MDSIGGHINVAHPPLQISFVIPYLNASVWPLIEDSISSIVPVVDASRRTYGTYLATSVPTCDVCTRTEVGRTSYRRLYTKKAKCSTGMEYPNCNSRLVVFWSKGNRGGIVARVSERRRSDVRSFCSGLSAHL